MQDKKIKILYIPSLNAGVSYWRIENYANTIFNLYKNDYVKVMVDYFFDPRTEIAWEAICLNNSETAKEIQDKLTSAFDMFDYIIFQKIQYIDALALIQRLRAGKKTKILAEIDDHIGDVNPSNIYNFKDHHNVAAQHCVMSDGIITSTEYLKEEIHKIVGEDKKIYVAPNCIDYKSWKLKRKKKSSKDTKQNIHIGYVAGAAHDEDLIIAYKAMLPILESNPNLKFIIRYGGFRPDYLKHNDQIDFKSISWNLDVYPKKLQSLNLDIALAPLRDTIFNRCKSNLKWIEWASIGVPLVASNIEPYTKTKGTIYLSNNNLYDFQKKILDAIQDLKKGINYKELLPKECRTNYNINIEAKKLLNFLRTV